jgi:DNA-binding Xre family transcriptional regulator
MKSDRTDYMIVMGHLKAALKRQKMNYRDLANGLGLSESGVKKIFLARDGSFQRINEICAYLGLTLSDVLSGTTETVRPIHYSDKQQTFLIENPKAFALYWKLVYERESVEKSVASLNLSEKSGFSVLRKLDQHRLIKLLPGGRVQLPPIQLIRWAGTGPLVEKIYREWSQELVRAVASPHPPPNAYFLIRYFKIKPKTYSDFLAALEDLEREFIRRGTKDMRSEAEDLVHFRWLTAVDNRSFIK